MTPEQARQLLEGTTPGPWEHEGRQPYIDSENFVIRQVGKPGVRIRGAAYGDTANIDLIATAPGMAAMIANMTTEYAVERNCSVIEGEPDWEKIGFGMYPGIIANTFWTTEKKLAEKLYKEAKTGHLPVRIVRRYATEPQPLEGESK